ncbi:MAG: hypothetical protein ACSHX6_16235 [Akkermansiaceae bacterium]
MNTKMKMRTPIDHTSRGIPVLFEKMAIKQCVVRSYDNEVTVNLSRSGFIALGEEIMSYQGEVIFNLSKVEQMQVERCDNRLMLWARFSDSSEIEIRLQAVQSIDFWNLLKCLDMDGSVYMRTSCKGMRTGDCPCCVKRVNVIKASTDKHPLALMLMEVSEGIVSDKQLEIELGENFCRAVFSMNVKSVDFHGGYAVLLGDGKTILNLSAIHSIRICGEVVDQMDCLNLIMYNSYADIIYKIRVHSSSPFKRWKHYLETACYSDQS